MWDGGGDGGVASGDEEEEVLSWKKGKKSREVSKGYPKALTDADVPISTAVWCVDDIPAWMFQTASCNQGKEWHRNTRKGKSLVYPAYFCYCVEKMSRDGFGFVEVSICKKRKTYTYTQTHTRTKCQHLFLFVNSFPPALCSQIKKKKKKVCSLSDRFETYSDPVTREAIQFWKWQK